MVSEIIEKKQQKPIKSGDMVVVNIPKAWRALIGIQNNGEIADDCTVALIRSKHGFLLGVWGNEQQK